MPLFGLWNELGYEIWHNGAVIYSAGNHRMDNTWISFDDDIRTRLTNDEIGAFCDQTGKELAEELGDAYLGGEHEKDVNLEEKNNDEGETEHDA